MRSVTRLSALVIAIAWSASAWAATYQVTDAMTRELPMDPDGNITIENLVGNIEVVGVDSRTLFLSARKVVSGMSDSAITEGRELTGVQIAGDGRNRLIRTLMPAIRSNRWTATVTYSLRVPHGAQITIGSHSSERIHVANVTGGVRVTNVNGTILLENTSGAATVDSSNGTIVYDSVSKPHADVSLSTVNGDVQVFVPSGSAFQWIATTLRGDVMTNLPARGHFESTTYRAEVNSSRGPTFKTASMMGNVWLVRKGSQLAATRSVRLPGRGTLVPPVPQVAARALQKPVVDGPLDFSTRLGNISVGQVRGNARIDTGAGEVQLGTVQGDCNVTSKGGPLSLGDIFGTLTASTGAGDVLVNAARAGGTVVTGGGMIRLIFAGGAVNLRSEGGDIVVRQAAGPVTAETKSGDIIANVNAAVRTAALDLRTSQGSVSLGISPSFGADIDATVITSDPETNGIHSDFNGLSIRREQMGNKVRIHAIGKINGGGERVGLYAEDGDIFISVLVSGVSPMAY